jgi:hypothetical protein
MDQQFPNALPLARGFIQFLYGLNVVAGVGLVLLLIVSFAMPDWATAMGMKPGPDLDQVKWGMRLIVIVGIASIPLNHVFLVNLRAIIDTVRAGDPFILPNADRLRIIAWTVLALQVLHLVIGALTKLYDAMARQLDMNWEFSITPWLTVLLLFILAKVFEHGARMHADLEGTV